MHENLYLCEKLGRSATFKFFIDVDLKHVRCSLDAVFEALKGKFQLCYKCTENKGFHFLSSQIVDFGKANELCENLIKQLYAAHPCIEWKLIIDSSVYRSGLRLLGSKKLKENRWYEEYPKKKDLSFEDFLKSVVVVSRSKAVTANVALNVSYNINENVTSVLSKFSKRYENAKITNIRKFGTCVCIATNSKFCQNIKSEHKSCNVYFVLNSENKLFQKCWCPCETPKWKSHCKCKDYRSRSITVPPSFNKLLKFN